MNVLEATDVVKTFREGSESVPVLRGASLALRRGEIVALEGPSGSGKTTFLTILGCMLTPTSGRVAIEGREVEPDPAGAAARGPSGVDRVRVPAVQPASRADGGRERRVRPEPQGHAGPGGEGGGGPHARGGGPVRPRRFLPRDLSGGQKQRVAIARALAGSAPIILADEPTANLDSQVGTRVLELFRTLAKREDRALLIVTHDPKVRDVADRVAHIRDGVILD